MVGIVAFVGTAIARAIGIHTVTSGIDWLELPIQVIVAALDGFVETHGLQRKCEKGPAKRALRGH